MIMKTLLFDYDHHWNHSFLFHYHLQHHLKHQWSSVHFCSTMISTGIILFYFIIISNIISNINDHDDTFVRLWSSLESFFSISLSPPTSSQTSMIISTFLFDYDVHWTHPIRFHYHLQYHLKHQWSWRHLCSTIIITGIILFHFITISNIISNINDHHHTLFDYDHYWNYYFLFYYHLQHHLKHQWSLVHFCSTMIITGLILFHFITNSNIISTINNH